VATAKEMSTIKPNRIAADNKSSKCITTCLRGDSIRETLPEIYITRHEATANEYKNLAKLLTFVYPEF